MGRKWEEWSKLGGADKGKEVEREGVAKEEEVRRGYSHGEKERTRRERKVHGISETME